MAERQFEISYKENIKKSVLSTLLGSLITTWIFIGLNYFETISTKGYYTSPFTFIEYHFVCIPVWGYGLPSYIFMNIIFTFLISYKLILRPIYLYYLSGILSYLISVVLFFISSFSYNSETLVFSFVVEAPLLLAYLLFFSKDFKQ